MLGLPQAEIVHISSNMGRHVALEQREIDGKMRLLTKPSRRLKLLQERIEEVLLHRVPLQDSVHGYRKKRSTSTAAAPHVGAAFLLSMDVKKFFPHIRFRRVYRVWGELGASPNVARILTMLTTFDGYAPLGFPTSCAIANLVRARPDARIGGLCRRIGLSYTNYSDNLYVSGRFVSQRAAEISRKAIVEEHLPLPQSRVKISGPGQSKRILGLAVNEKLNVRREYRRRVRAEVHHVSTSGADADDSALESVRGKVGYVASLNAHHGRRLAARLASLPRSLL